MSLRCAPNDRAITRNRSNLITEHKHWRVVHANWKWHIQNNGAWPARQPQARTTAPLRKATGATKDGEDAYNSENPYLVSGRATRNRHNVSTKLECVGLRRQRQSHKAENLNAPTSPPRAARVYTQANWQEATVHKNVAPCYQRNYSRNRYGGSPQHSRASLQV